MIGLLVCLLVPAVLGAPLAEERIVGGQEVDIKDFPWQGSYRGPTGKHFCGCAFVGGRYVISAAHCGGETSYKVAFGATNRKLVTDFNIASITLHPDYEVGPSYEPNDISLIVTTTLVSGENVRAGVLPTTGNPGGTGWITGWGRTCMFCSVPLTLQGAEMNIMTDKACKERWKLLVSTKLHLCVYTGQQSACTGDSGGPLSQGDVIYGLTSWVGSGCSPDNPSVYTRVGAFHGWLCHHTGGRANGC